MYIGTQIHPCVPVDGAGRRAQPQVSGTIFRHGEGRAVTVTRTVVVFNQTVSRPPSIRTRR
eukprot:2818328-Rhodomonas_salina.1